MEVSEIIESVNIVDYISQFCDLEERQDGEYWGLSPLKNENTPSFSVNAEKQCFYDFSSGSGGNVLDFICKYNSCNFYKGIHILKEYAGIQGEAGEVKRLACTSIAKRYKIRAPAEKKVERSSFFTPEYMDRYSWDLEKLSSWTKEGISVESLGRFCVRYDSFSDRIVFPIRNLQGNIINICGRTLDPDYKEKKLRKYTYFAPLGTLDTIYGFSDNVSAIQEKREIILFEGAKSVMLADTWGIHNTGAIMTSHLNPNQLKILIKLGVRVVFALDADVDINEDRNISKLKPYTEVKYIKNMNKLLDEKDSPVDKGLDVFKCLYNSRRRL